MNGRIEFCERQKLQDSIVDLCKRGLLSCTRGKLGEPNTTYALGWLPLDRPETFTETVQLRHKENMRRLIGNNLGDG